MKFTLLPLLACLMMLPSVAYGFVKSPATLKPVLSSRNPVPPKVGNTGKFKSELIKILASRKGFTRYQTGDISDAETIRRIRTLGVISVVAGAAGLAFLFIPYLAYASLALIPGALVFGIIGVIRATKTTDPKAAGYKLSLIGVLLGFLGVVTLMVLAAIATFILALESIFGF